MHTRRLVKRSILGSRVYAPSPTGDGAPLTGVVQAVKQENRDVSTGPLRNVYTLLMQDGSLKEFSEDEIAVGFSQTTAKGPLKSSLKSFCNGRGDGTPHQGQNGEANSLSPDAVEGERAVDGRRTGRTLEGPERDHTRSVSLLDQKRKVVSSSIDVPHARKSEEEVDMDKVTAAMVLTSLSSSPLVRSPPVKVSEGLNGSWKESGVGFTPSSYSSSGYWSWSGPSDQSNPSTPSPPLSADCFKPFRMSSVNGPPPDDAIDEQDGSSLLFDEPIPRKRKNSMKVMFKCLWKNCGKVLSTAAGIQRHIRTVHLGRNCDSDCSDGEEDFYYSEIKLNTDSVADGLSSLSPVSPSVLAPISPPHDHHRRPPAEGSNGTNGNKDNHSHTHSNSTPLSRSAPSALYLIHAEHAYQATAPVTIPFSGSGSGPGPGSAASGSAASGSAASGSAASGSAASTSFTPSSSSTFSISWQSPPVTFTGTAASPTHSRTQSFGEQRSQTIAVLSSPPRATGSLSRKSRGEGKKCRKVYGMENRDMWCTACRWKKACQRFTD
ncbi:zinc finger protein 704 isoform X2 [Salmo salar]|uniref:Zinc finger protein 704 isoform X2 n=1 Tax=Salmo salar TaxID=8030 RepID=A0A1S3Q2V3_SALSA|nr:zinc finger protein 704 isoform X2 [Salmo salar]|eukprot:XP_014033739.1 PREDICTED: zinc finger protein 704-like isoform X2 [Salmo salar]